MYVKNFPVNVMSGDESDESVIPLLNDAEQVIRVEAEVSDVNKLSAALHADGVGTLLADGVSALHADSVGTLHAANDSAGLYNGIQMSALHASAHTPAVVKGK